MFGQGSTDEVDWGRHAVRVCAVRVCVPAPGGARDRAGGRPRRYAGGRWRPPTVTEAEQRPVVSPPRRHAPSGALTKSGASNAERGRAAGGGSNSVRFRMSSCRP